MPFTPSRRGPALPDGAGGSSERPVSRTADPVQRVKGHVTESIVLADDAEYDLGKFVAGAEYEVRWLEDELPKSARFKSVARSDIATSALQKSSTVLTATVASGAAANLQVGQWVRIRNTGATAAADTYNAVHQVVTTTATTITFTVADTGVETDEGIEAVEVEGVILPVAAEPIVLWDSIIGADNQDANLGAVQRGVYTVISGAGREVIMSAAGAFMQYADIITAAGPLAITHDLVLDATSDTLTALFVSSGDVILRNGADTATKLTVTFQALEHAGVDQDGSVCLYSKAANLVDRDPTVRLKNRTGASETFEIERVR